MPKISVIMCAYNSARYIEESIYSVLGQTFKDLELIVVNDCSTDNTAKVVASIAEKDPRVRLINNETNIKQSLSRNKAIKTAGGEYIAVLDSDDISLPRRLELQSAYLDNNPEISLVGSAAEIINDQGELIGMKRPATDPDRLKFELIAKNPLIASSALYRKSAMEKLGGYDNNYVHSEDHKLYSDLVKFSKIATLPEVLIKYRHSPSSVSVISQTRKLQLNHAIEISFHNLSGYIDISREKAKTFFNVLNGQNNNTIPLLSSLRTYRKLVPAYINKENLSNVQAEKIWEIYTASRKKVIRRYLKSHFPTLVNMVKKMIT